MAADCYMGHWRRLALSPTVFLSSRRSLALMASIGFSAACSFITAMILLFGNVYGLWSRLGALGFSGTGRRVRGEWRTGDKYSGRGRRGTEAPDSLFQEGGEIRAREADREAAADAQRALTAGVQDIRALLSQMAAADIRRALRAEFWEIQAKVDREAAADAQRALIQAVRAQMAAADAQLAEVRDIKALLDSLSAQLADRHRIDHLYVDNPNMTMNNGPVFGQTFQTVVLSANNHANPYV